MNQKSTTADERFLVALYRAAMQNGDPYDEIDCGGIAKAIGQNEKAVKNIVKLLAQANFIKKNGETVYLTQQGCNFVLDELEGE